MQLEDMTDLRQVESVKTKFETVLDALQEVADSPEYESLKALIIERTGGLELDDVVGVAVRFSRGIDDLEAIAMGEEETETVLTVDEPTEADKIERQESLSFWAKGNSTEGKDPTARLSFPSGEIRIVDPMSRGNENV